MRATSEERTTEQAVEQANAAAADCLMAGLPVYSQAMSDLNLRTGWIHAGPVLIEALQEAVGDIDAAVEMLGECTPGDACTTHSEPEARERGRNRR